MAVNVLVLASLEGSVGTCNIHRKDGTKNPNLGTLFRPS